jgi:ubiquinone/menaquinone biosynthesis C-methylase UbiE
MKILKNVSNFYNKLSNIGKILILIVILLITIIFFKSIIPSKEGMIVNDKILYKEGNTVYDDFYATIYDYLVYNGVKNDYEIGTIINSTNPVETSFIADIGCGTGHHVANISAKNLNVVGIDISEAMIKKAKTQYPNSNFMVGDALNTSLFKMHSLTHILCLYFTIYFFQDKRKFFDNCMNWLMNGGYLIVHLVDRESFDPILPPGNPLYVVSPQKYAKERITKTKVVFNDFTYVANFNLDKDSNIATFEEKFKFNDGKVRKQEQKLYMENTTDIVNMAQESGFIFQGKIDLVKCAYENQYLYLFYKPI